MIKALFIFGTRPEAIKVAPLIKVLNESRGFQPIVCVTAQHREMLDQVLNFFEIKTDYDLNLMKPNQNLFDITSESLTSLHPVIEDCKPDIIIVQGDTTTAFVGALAAYYKKIPVAHIEAGLRSNDKFSPYPEEINRKMIDHLSDYHFAPTSAAEINLVGEGLSSNIYLVGNTVVDAMLSGLKIVQSEEEKYYIHFNYLDFSKKIILVTGHRRESFGKPFVHICNALKDIALERDDIIIVYPVHLNPAVREPVKRILMDVPNIKLIEPLDYPHFIWLMSKSYIILTDSGGVQEEAPSLGKPVLIMREKTERTEGVSAGIAKLVGRDRKKIFDEVIDLLTDEKLYENMSFSENPYGDGTASLKIMEILKKSMNMG